MYLYYIENCSIHHKDVYFPALLNSNLYVEGSPTMKNQDSDLGKDLVGLKRSRSEGSILDPSDVAQCKFL